MIPQVLITPRFGLRIFVAGAVVAVLGACSNTVQPQPASLPAEAIMNSVRQSWVVRVPADGQTLHADASGDLVAVASAEGTVVVIDTRSGAERWRASVGAPLSSGVGASGALAAVVTASNELVLLDSGKVRWKQRLTAQVYTAPLVTSTRVFVQAADRTTSAWDVESGRRLWVQSRPADALLLKKPGVLLMTEDSVVVGSGGRLVGLRPEDGGLRWDVPIAAPRGTNEVERLVDLTGPGSRVGSDVCVRAYDASLGCVDTSRGAAVWTRPARGAEGLSGDEKQVYGTETNGDVIALRRVDGSRLWLSDRLRHRLLTTPLLVGSTLIIGDSSGVLHFVSSDDGKPLGHFTPDGSAILTAPVQAGNTVVVTTRNGNVFGYRIDALGGAFALRF